MTPALMTETATRPANPRLSKQPTVAEPAPNFNVIADRDFNDFRELIYALSGISLNTSKRMLVCSRLSKRLRALELRSYRDYYDLLRSQNFRGPEVQTMINCITTNKTEFFREPHHFDFLQETILPEIEALAGENGKQARVWCAASSKGHEPYTLAMVLDEYFRERSGWQFKLLATDIDTDVLAAAQRGIYTVDEILDVPERLKQRYLLRGSRDQKQFVSVRPELRQQVTFRQLNLISEPWPLKTRFDVIFCRNVIIYFDRPTQERLISRLADQLRPGGYLLLGHSENIPWSAERFDPLGSTIYRLR